MRKTTPPVDAADITLSGDALIELSPLGLMLSSQRKILLCNTAFAHLFGYEASEMQAASLAMLYPSVDEFERIGQRGWQVMARELGLSPRTVEKLRGRLRAHFGARNAAELMSRIGGMPS